MSDLVIKNFDRKAGNVALWVAGAMLFLSLAFPFYHALHFAVAPASELLTGFAKDQGVQELSMFQRMASFVFFLPGTLLFCMSLFVGAIIGGDLALDLKRMDLGPVRRFVYRWMPATIVLVSAFLAVMCNISLRMVDAVQTWGVTLTEEIQIFGQVPASFLVLAGAIVIAVVIHRMHAAEINAIEAASA